MAFRNDDPTGLRQLFHSIDADGSGTITVDELRSALSRCGSVVQVRPPRLLQLHKDFCTEGLSRSMVVLMLPVAWLKLDKCDILRGQDANLICLHYMDSGLYEGKHLKDLNHIIWVPRSQSWRQ